MVPHYLQKVTTSFLTTYRAYTLLGALHTWSYLNLKQSYELDTIITLILEMRKLSMLALERISN